VTRRVGFWMDVHAWVAEDGEHVIVSHECVAGRDVSQLPHPTWVAKDGRLDPSFSCGLCGVHCFPDIEDGPAPALERVAALVEREAAKEES
jgi:hypothetical protein